MVKRWNRSRLAVWWLAAALLVSGCADSLRDAAGNAPNPGVTLGLVAEPTGEAPRPPVALKAAADGAPAAALSAASPNDGPSSNRPPTADAPPSDGLPAGGPPAGAAAVTPTDASDGPEAVVRSFYAWYLDQAHGDASPLTTQAYRRSEYLSPALIAHVDELLAVTPNPAGYDPFLCAPAVPDRVEIGAVQMGPVRAAAGASAAGPNAAPSFVLPRATPAIARASAAATSAAPEQASVIVRNGYEDRSTRVDLARAAAGGSWQIVGITCAAGDGVGQIATPAAGAAATPEQTVQRFYDWYLAEVRLGHNPLTSGDYKASPYLSADAVQSLSQLLAALGSEPGYDPILCAQDAPVSVSVELTELAGDAARVFVRMAWGSGPDTSQTAQLKLTDGQWRIISLTCAVQKPETGPTP